MKFRKKSPISENQNSSSLAVRLILGIYSDAYHYAVVKLVNLGKNVLCKWRAISLMKRSISLRLSSLGAISRERFILCYQMSKESNVRKDRAISLSTQTFVRILMS